MVLADAALERLGTCRPSPGLLRSSQLLSEFAWSGRTAATRNSQWRAWVDFCTADDRPLLPVTEAHFVSFVGWLTSEREAGRRQVSTASLPQYFSAVRQMQVVLTGIPVPQFPFLPMLSGGTPGGKKHTSLVVRCVVAFRLLFCRRFGASVCRQLSLLVFVMLPW